MAPSPGTCWPPCHPLLRWVPTSCPYPPLLPRLGFLLLRTPSLSFCCGKGTAYLCWVQLIFAGIAALLDHALPQLDSARNLPFCNSSLWMHIHSCLSCVGTPTGYEVPQNSDDNSKRDTVTYMCVYAAGVGDPARGPIRHGPARHPSSSPLQIEARLHAHKGICGPSSQIAICKCDNWAGNGLLTMQTTQFAVRS